MALDTSGNPVQVALIADPFARQLVLASMNGSFSLTDGPLDPLDLFTLPADPDPDYPDNDVPSSYKGAVLILNSLSTPLRLVQALEIFPAGGDAAYRSQQLAYPATVNASGAWTEAHVIPGARPYPKPAQHQRPQGGPALIGGVGLYRFQKNIKWALSFSAQEDGSGPLIGVGFWLQQHDDGSLTGTPWYRFSSAVSADLAKDYSSDLNTFFTRNFQPGADSVRLYDIGAQFTVWGSFVNSTLVVWVRDNASTLGYL